MYKSGSRKYKLKKKILFKDINITGTGKIIINRKEFK